MTFNLVHAQKAAEFARFAFAEKRKGSVAVGNRAVIPNDDDLFQTIPHQFFVGEKENLYHAIIHLVFTYLGQYIQSEVSVLRGRAGAVVQTATHAYLFEFKLDGSAEEALAQIKQRDYAAPFRTSGKEMVTVGVNFSSAEKRVVGWLVE